MDAEYIDYLDEIRIDFIDNDDEVVMANIYGNGDCLIESTYAGDIICIIFKHIKNTVKNMLHLPPNQHIEVGNISLRDTQVNDNNIVFIINLLGNDFNFSVKMN